MAKSARTSKASRFGKPHSRSASSTGRGSTASSAPKTCSRRKRPDSRGGRRLDDALFSRLPLEIHHGQRTLSGRLRSARRELHRGASEPVQRGQRTLPTRTRHRAPHAHRSTRSPPQARNLRRRRGRRLPSRRHLRAVGWRLPTHLPRELGRLFGSLPSATTGLCSLSYIDLRDRAWTASRAWRGCTISKASNASSRGASSSTPGQHDRRRGRARRYRHRALSERSRRPLVGPRPRRDVPHARRADGIARTSGIQRRHRALARLHVELPRSFRTRLVLQGAVPHGEGRVGRRRERAEALPSSRPIGDAARLHWSLVYARGYTS